MDWKRTNPYLTSTKATRIEGPRLPSQALALPFLALGTYYIISSLTLPFADDLWFGELPALAIVQLPKMYFFDAAREAIILLMRKWGLSSGSASPDLMAAGPWAMAVLFTVPATVVIGLTGLVRRISSMRWWILLLLATAAADAAVTIWFDRVSSLSLF